MNSLFVINPYKWNGQWVFDNEERGLVKEAFVAKADLLLDIMCEKLKCAPEKGVRVVFAPHWIPDYNVKLTWKRADVVGNWYDTGMGFEAWYCPALELFMSPPPKEIYGRVTPAS